MILAFFAVLGVGGGLLVLVSAIGRSYELAGAGLIPLLIGMVAFSGVCVVLAVDEARKDIVAKLAERQ